MKKFKVQVEIIKEYEIEIDETVINDEFIEDFESVMYKLDDEDNKYKSIAHDIARIRACDYSYEGYGYPLVNGKKSVIDDGQDNVGINFTKIDEDYCDVTVEELE